MRIVSLLLISSLMFVLSACAGNSYPTNDIPVHKTHVKEEPIDAPPEDLRSVVGHDGWYNYGGYYYPSRAYYNRYRRYYGY